MLTRDDALKIASKLGAQKDIKKRNRPHDLYIVRHNGRIIGQIGVRRGSNRDAGHDHISKNLRTPQQMCLGLAQCPVSREQWIAFLTSQNLI